MSEELDKAAQAFTTEVAPASRPRDQAGKFVETRGAPEPMFGPHGEVEGGDDAGDDPRRRSQEVEVSRANQRQTDRDDNNDDVHGDQVPESRKELGIEDIESDASEGELTDEERAVVEAGDGEVSERRRAGRRRRKVRGVVVDGHPFEVTLGEALNGYVRQ